MTVSQITILQFASVIKCIIIIIKYHIHVKKAVKERVSTMKQACEFDYLLHSKIIL